MRPGIQKRKTKIFNAGLLLAGCILFLLVLAYKTNQEKNSQRRSTIGAGGIESLESVAIDGTEQWLLIRGQNRRSPVVLVLHGGPGAGSIGFAREFYAELERDFVVVNWDQRGAGKSFELASPADPYTPGRFVADTRAIVTFLKQKLQAPKLFLVGHSWGGYIGAIYAHRYPDDLYAYIGIGPVVRGDESVRISYEFVRAQAERERADGASALTMAAYMRNRRAWLNRYAVGMFHGPHAQDEDAYLRGVMIASPDYTLANILTYLPGLWRTQARLRGQFFAMNLFEQAPAIDAPVYFVTGRHDYYNPPEILQQYAGQLRAPGKKIIWFDHCAHAPHFEDPSRFAEVMRAIKAETVP